MLQEKPLVSVIIPVYNSEKYLDRCVRSVLNQTYNNIEVILVDDGSVDNSGLICDRWQQEDNRVRTYHKENGGQASARNYGILTARGEYITFVDNDDWIELNMYERLIDMALKFNTDITGCATTTEFENGVVYNNFIDKKESIVDACSCILDVLYQRKHCWGTVWNKLFKRWLFNDLLFPEGMQLEDYVVILRIFNQSNGIYFCSDPMYHYAHRSGSQSKKAFYLGKLTILEAANNIKTYFVENSASKEILKGVNSFVFRMYADVFWDVLKSKPNKWKEIIGSKRRDGLNAMRCYLTAADKCISDMKMITKFMVAIIMSCC